MDEGRSVLLNGAGSTDALSGVGSFAWDIDGDGFSDGNSSTLTFPATDGPATVAISLKVVDKAGNEVGRNDGGEDQQRRAGRGPFKRRGLPSTSQSALNSGHVLRSRHRYRDRHRQSRRGDASDHRLELAVRLPARAGGAFLVVITATDSDGAFSEKTFKLVVKDLPPILAGPSNMTVGNDLNDARRGREICRGHRPGRFAEPWLSHNAAVWQAARRARGRNPRTSSREWMRKGTSDLHLCCHGGGPRSAPPAPR